MSTGGDRHAGRFTGLRRMQRARQVSRCRDIHTVLLLTANIFPFAIFLKVRRDSGRWFCGLYCRVFQTCKTSTATAMMTHRRLGTGYHDGWRHHAHLQLAEVASQELVLILTAAYGCIAEKEELVAGSREVRDDAVLEVCTCSRRNSGWR